MMEIDSLIASFEKSKCWDGHENLKHLRKDLRMSITILEYLDTVEDVDIIKHLDDVKKRFDYYTTNCDLNYHIIDGISQYKAELEKCNVKYKHTLLNVILQAIFVDRFILLQIDQAVDE